MSRGMGRGSMRRDPEAVPKILRTLLARLSATDIPRTFYLAGGTGLALLLHHRRSIDLDFFSRTNRLDFEGRRSLVAQLRRLPGWSLTEAREGTVHGRLGRVRVSFFWYPEPLVKPLIHQGRLHVASLEDIGLMKLGAIIGRGSRKDFVDLYTICQHVPLPRLLALGHKKFRDSSDFTLQALKALVFFDDAQQEPPLLTTHPVAWDAVKRFFAHEVRGLTRRSLRR